MTTIPRTEEDQPRESPLVLDYTPDLVGVAKDRFYEAAHSVAFQPLQVQVARLTDAAAHLEAVEGSGAVATTSDDQMAVMRGVAALRLLRDLLQIGWVMSLVGPTRIALFQPVVSNDTASAKEQVRASMKAERLDSLKVPAVRQFIRSMERGRTVNGEDRSIFTLIADGQGLASCLRGIAGMLPAERATELRQAVQPYLQQVTGEARDEFTGMRLMDIWRYFRLSWVTPYRATPGRNLFYLVRDAGQPYHPVMGIGALGNCVIGLKSRDDKIGWTPDAVASRLRDARQRSEQAFTKACWELADLLQVHLDRGLAEIAIDGITSRNEVAYPSDEGISLIEKIAEDAREERYGHLQRETLSVSEPDLELTPPDAYAVGVPIREQRDSATALFRRKRATKLASLLRAKLLFQRLTVFDNPTSGVPALLWQDKEVTVPYEAGRSALRAVLNANKETKIGTSMMEIIVCGAIPPYNHLLGGKLVAMLLTSPQVVRDYAERYGRYTSTIASRVAGRDVARPAQLVFLGTTSLYVAAADKERFRALHTERDASTHGEGERTSTPWKPNSASQYNRIKVPATVVGGTGEIRYDCIGITEGFGVVHFSADTREALERLDVLLHKARRVNSMFGEGTSPRMRKIRQGLSLLGVDERFLVHGQQRLVYNIGLAHNTERYLLGLEEAPDYILPWSEGATNAIAGYWVDRWLASRVTFAPALDRVKAFSHRDFAISRDVESNIASDSDQLALPEE